MMKGEGRELARYSRHLSRLRMTKQMRHHARLDQHAGLMHECAYISPPPAYTSLTIILYCLGYCSFSSGDVIKVLP